MNPMPEPVNETDRKDLVFFAVFGCFFWIWGPMLIGMICWDIAQNFRGQINAGHKMLMEEGEMQEVT